jgi:spore coat protein U-like protein
MSRAAAQTPGGLLLCLICLCGPAAPAFALSCSINASNVAFGSFVPAGSPVDATGIMILHCNGVSPNRLLRVCVNISAGPASDATSRFMIGPGSAQLRYQLYTDSGRTIPWGSWQANLYGGGYQWDLIGLRTNLTAAKAVYGRVFANQQSAVPGPYSAPLTVSITYSNFNPAACPQTLAQSTTTAMNAVATVTAGCAVSATNLNFGDIIPPQTTNIDATSSISAQCPNGMPYAIGLDQGMGPGATINLRQMTGGGTNLLGYSLFQDPSRTTVWGNTVGTNTVSGTGNGTPQSYTVYGRVPSAAGAAPGGYADTITVTLTF